VICSGPRRGKQHTYALLDHRVPASPLDDLPRERAVAELARRFFASHGPATVKDFTAWSSLTAAETKAALEEPSGELEVELDGAGTAWYGGRVGGGPARRDRRAFLIPTYDETIVGYQSLRLAPAHPVSPGAFERVAVVDARTVGSWKRRASPSRVVVELTPYRALSDKDARALASVTRRLGRFLGAEAALETNRPVA